MEIKRPLMYVLVNKKPVAVDNMDQWGHFFKVEANKRVAFDTVGGVDVSTVFLGLDHNHSQTGPPILFETMIFYGEHDQKQWRCCTWEEAEEMHKKAVELVKAGFN